MELPVAIELLESCEKGLRKLGASALEAGDYAVTQRITDLARAVAALAAEGKIEPQSACPSPHSTAAKNASPLSTSRARSISSAPNEYPQFFRRGDELVKIGWSKKHKGEYNHRAPFAAIQAVAASVRQLGAKRKNFNGDALLPLKYTPDGAPAPDYQAYVALAWLKHLGVVEQLGRRAGFTVVPEKQIEAIVTSAWPELAEWRGYGDSI